MNTPCKDLYRLIRYEVIRQDNDQILPASDLDLAIESVVVFELEGFEVVDNAGEKEIQPAVDTKTKKWLILKTALSLLIPEDSFSYRTAALSKVLVGMPGLEEQREALRQRLEQLESDISGKPVLSSNELDAFVNQGQRLLDTISDARGEIL